MDNLFNTYPYKDLCVELNLGYYKEFNRGKLEDKDGKEIQTSEDWGKFDMWDGYRLGITLSYPIFKNINLSETK